MLESLFNKVAGLYEVFKNTYFYRTPPVAASVLIALCMSELTYTVVNIANQVIFDSGIAVALIFSSTTVTFMCIFIMTFIASN